MTNTEYFRPSDAQAVVGVSKSTIYNLKKKRGLPIEKIGGMSFVSVAAFRKLMNPLGDQLGD